MSFKSLSLLTGRCPNTFKRYLICSRYSQLYLLPEKHELSSHYLPILISKRSFTINKLSSNVANQEKLSKESTNVVEVPPLQFKDIPFDQAVPHEVLISALQKYDSLADQMHCLDETLSLSPEDIKKRKEFCLTIEQLLKPFFINFKIEMFGSTVNNFGFKGCDIDMTFDTTAKANDMTCYLERPDVPMVSEVLSGKVSVQELSELPLREQLLFIHSVFLEYYKDSEIPAKFINAHVPLVRFYHDKYNLKCDLTLKNRVAHANTRLLYTFAKLDKRVPPLMKTLRYWGKHTELIGKGLVFNTYTISLLVVYFLQTRSPPVLPAADNILPLLDKLDSDIIDDKSLLDIINSIPPSKNNQTIEELFREFFFFYLYFDFTRVICPLTATSVARDEFFSKEENCRFRMNSICVQDPLCLSHNVAELVDFKYCKKFSTELITVCKLFQYNFDSNSDNKLNLVTIFDKPKEIVFHEVDDKKIISFDICLLSKNMLWSEDKVAATAQNILHILQDVLLFDCQTLELNQITNLLKVQDKVVSKRKKEFQERKTLFKFKVEEVIPHLKNRRPRNSSEKTEDNYSNRNKTLYEQFQSLLIDNKLILCSKCEVSKNTWLGRDLVDLSSISSDKFLEQQKIMSDLVAKQNAANLEDKKIKPFMFLFESYFNPSKPEKSMVVFRPLHKMSFNPVLGIFLREYIPNVMRKISD